jgi:hypothetical protein
MHSFPKRKYYVLRLLGGISAGLLVCLLEVFISNLIFTIVTMYLLTFYVAFFIWLCLDVSLLQAVSLSAAALLMQDAANSIYQSVSNAFFENLEGVLYWLLYVAVFAVSYVILWFVFIRRLKKEKVNLKQKDILFLVVIVVIANQIIVTVGTQLAEDFWSNQFIRLYFLICCLLTLFLQFGFFKQNKLEIENQQMEKIINQQAEQYRLSKENIELINLKCHDLKKQIQSIRKISNKEEFDGCLDEVEKSVMIYDSIARTKNEALNTILTEKSLLCEKNHIYFTCMADCDKLSFMNNIDVYSLFANILDNAIECEQKEPSEDKRYVSLMISTQGNVLVIHSENYCNHSLEFEDGLPVTTNEDKNIHGYGMKSIRFITEKYNGALNAKLKDNMFTLDIVFPLA